MIDTSTMVASLPSDLRGRLRGDVQDVSLRRLAMLAVESRGDCCPQWAMDAALDAWAELGFPDPVEGDPHCPYCGGRLVVFGEGGVEPPKSFSSLTGPELPVPRFWCGPCDHLFGPSWDTDADKRLQVRGWGSVPGL
jgi:hypothetical protein